MNKNAVYPCLVLISLLLTAGAVSADIPPGHKPIPCFGCHAETLNADYGPGECGNCHDYILGEGGGFNVPLLQSRHNPNICTACHMGNTLVNASARDIFHNGHNAVECKQCHETGNSTIVKIQGIEEKGYPCVACHGNQIHSIHIKNLDKICSICHGSWAKDKVYAGNSASSPSNNSQKNLEKFTIFDLIKNLFNAIFGMI